MNNSKDEFEMGHAGDASINLAKGQRKDFGSNEDILKKLKELKKDTSLSDILEMNKNEITMFLGDINALPAKKKQKLMDITIECFYDQNWCEKNKIDYSSLSDREYNAVLIYNYIRLEEKK